MDALLDRFLPLGGPLLVAVTLGMWVRYFMTRFGEDDEVPRLRGPVVVTGFLLVVLVAIVVLEEPVA